MQHYHLTDISHGHTASDSGHTHDFAGGGQVQDSDQYADMEKNYHYTGSNAPNWGWHKAVLTGHANITVADFSGSKWSGGSCVDATGTAKYQTDSNNPSATETRPTNFTVKIWKRTA